MAKNYYVALILALVGGWVGLHHLYLGRNRHAVIYMFTFGGFFIGVFHDIIKMKKYIEWANFDHDFKERYLSMTRKDPEPKMSLARGFAITMVAQMFGNLVHLAVPSDLLNPTLNTFVVSAVVPAAVAFAVHFIGSVGEYEGNFKNTLKSAYITAPLYWWNPNSELYTSLVAGYFFRKSWKYRVRPEHPGSIGYRSLYIAGYLTLIFVLFASLLCFNCTVESEGETVKCRDALRRFFTSPLWQDIVASLRQIRESIQEHGWEHISETVILLMDPTGELHALTVLGINKGATDDEIKRAYRNLAREHHPDKNKDKSQEERDAAEIKFMEVQEAYSVLAEKLKKKSKS